MNFGKPPQIQLCCDIVLCHLFGAFARLHVFLRSFHAHANLGIGTQSIMHEVMHQHHPGNASSPCHNALSARLHQMRALGQDHCPPVHCIEMVGLESRIFQAWEERPESQTQYQKDVLAAVHLTLRDTRQIGSTPFCDSQGSSVASSSLSAFKYRAAVRKPDGLPLSHTISLPKPRMAPPYSRVRNLQVS